MEPHPWITHILPPLLYPLGWKQVTGLAYVHEEDPTQRHEHEEVAPGATLEMTPYINISSLSSYCTWLIFLAFPCSSSRKKELTQLIPLYLATSYIPALGWAGHLSGSTSLVRGEITRWAWLGCAMTGWVPCTQSQKGPRSATRGCGQVMPWTCERHRKFYSQSLGEAKEFSFFFFFCSQPLSERRGELEGRNSLKIDPVTF